MPCLEVLVNTGRVSSRIEDPRITSEIPDVIAEGEYYGMCTFDQSLVKLVADGAVSAEQAMEALLALVAEGFHEMHLTAELREAELRDAEEREGGGAG